MTKNFMQCSFDFTVERGKEAKEVQKWVEQHNHQVFHQISMAAQLSGTLPGSLLTALDRKEVKGNVVYLLRGLLNQNLRKSMGSSAPSFKRNFLKTLQGEIAVKKTPRDPTFTLWDILIKTHTVR